MWDTRSKNRLHAGRIFENIGVVNVKRPIRPEREKIARSVSAKKNDSLDSASQLGMELQQSSEIRQRSEGDVGQFLFAQRQSKSVACRASPSAGAR